MLLPAIQSLFRSAFPRKSQFALPWRGVEVEQNPLESFESLRERLRATFASYAADEIDVEEYLAGLAVLIAARKGISIPEDELRKLAGASATEQGRSAAPGS